MLDNAGAIGNPNSIDTVGSQKRGPQVGEGAARLEDADNNLGSEGLGRKTEIGKPERSVGLGFRVQAGQLHASRCFKEPPKFDPSP